MTPKSEKRWLNTLLPIAQSRARAVVYHEFVTFLNPKYRGPNWKWENFEEFAVQQAEVTAYQSFSDSDWKEYENYIRETARRTARIWAKTVMQDSGLMEWWPNPEKVTPDNFDQTRQKSLDTTNLDFDQLREKLREYDKNVPRCPITRQKEVTWGDFVGHETLTCCRPEGHEGECRGSRLVLGWPGYETISELIRLAEIATSATKEG